MPKSTPKPGRTMALRGEDTPEIKKFKKVFGPVRDARLALAALEKPQRIVVPGMTSQEVQTLAKKLGLDPQVVEQKAAQQTAEVLRSAETYRAQVIEQSGTAKKFLSSATQAWVSGATITLGQVQRYFVDAPFLIWPTPLLALDAATIQPANSIVTFHYHLDAGSQSASGIQEVSILFRWTNPSNYATAISVDGYIVFSGSAQAHAHGGWLGADSTSLGVYGGLEVYGDWDPSHTLLGETLDETSIALFAEPNGLTYKHSVTESGSVFRAYDLRIDQIGIPAAGEITVNLSVQIWYGMGQGGYVDVDFSSGSFGVTTPGVLITSWPTPAETI